MLTEDPSRKLTPFFSLLPIDSSLKSTGVFAARVTVPGASSISSARLVVDGDPTPR